MPTAMARHRRAGRLERRHRRLLGPGALPLAGPGQLVVELLLAAEQQRAGDRARRRAPPRRCGDARMPCFLYFWPWRQALGARRDDEAGLAAALELGIDGGDHDVDVGDAAVGDPRLGAVEDPLVGGLVVDRPGAQRATRRSRRRARRRRTRRAGSCRRCRSTAGTHSMTCSGVPLPAMPAAARPEPKIDRPMPASPQNSSSRATGSVRPVLVAERRLGEEVERVEADLGRLLDDRPRELLALVPLVGGGADDVLGEVVDPLLDLQLVLVEGEREVAHAHGPWSVWRDGPHYRAVTRLAGG